MDVHLAALQRPFAELAALPEGIGPDDEVVNGQRVYFTVFSHNRAPDTVVVVLQAAIKAFFGLGTRTFEKGFVVSQGGGVRVASTEEVRSAL
jgi:hypothetical protein